MNDRWERLIDLYHSAVSLPADERATLLAEECGDDPALQADVERMVIAQHRVRPPTGAAPAIAATRDEPTSVESVEPPPRTEAPSLVPPSVVTEPREGEPISAYADARRLSIAERLQLFIQLCNAVATGHRRGIAHGHLTPDDIYVTAAGLPKLPDIGLGDDEATQADDVRALGAVLDRLLGGGVSGARRPLRRELDTIVLRALGERERGRYESVSALVDDIRRYLETPRPARERRDVERTAPVKVSRRRGATIVTWMLASAATVALGVKVAALLEGRTNNAPAAVQADVPAARTRVAVADLTDRASDYQLAAALSDALRDGLTESPSVVLVSTRPQAEISGTIERIAGGTFTITLQLSKPRNSDGPKTLQETTVDSSDVIHALGRLAEALREQLGESPASIAATPRLQDVTTASVPALRAFAHATRAVRAGDRTSAIRSLKAAVALDTGFASAHRLLAITHRELADRARAREANDHVVANQSRLPFYERNMTIASHAMNIDASYAAAIDAYNRILSRDPRDARILNSLGNAHATRREYAVQESLLVRAIAVDSDAPSLYAGLAMAAVNQGNYDGARRVLDRTEQRFPGLRSTQRGRVAVAASQQDWNAAEREAREMVARTPADSADALDAQQTLGRIVMTQGRLAEAEQAFRRVIALGGRRGAVAQTFSAALSLAYLELRYRHAAGAAVATMNSALTRFPLARMEAEDRPPYDEVARLFVDAGQPARAADLLAQARARGFRSTDANRRWTAGALAIAEGRAWEGEIEIHGAAEAHPCPVCALPDLARAYEVAGKPDSAIAIYERYLREPWQRRFETDAVELGFAMKRLGELYQQQNDRARAAAKYTALLQLWRGGDPELEPLLADVRRRLEQTSDAVARR